MSSNPEPDIYETFRQLETIIKFLKRTSFQRIKNPNIKVIFNLSVRQLTCLAGVNDLTKIYPDGVALKQLAQFLQLTLPAASLLVDSMVKKKLLYRTENPDDRRVLRISLSREGEEAFAQLSHEMDISVEALMDGISLDDQLELQRIVAKIYGKLEI